MPDAFTFEEAQQPAGGFTFAEAQQPKELFTFEQAQGEAPVATLPPVPEPKLSPYQKIATQQRMGPMGPIDPEEGPRTFVSGMTGLFEAPIRAPMALLRARLAQPGQPHYVATPAGGTEPTPPPPLFIIGPGGIRQETRPEQFARSAANLERPAYEPQIGVEPSDMQKILSASSTPDMLLALPVGLNRTGAKLLLFSMVPGLAQQVTDIVRGGGSQQDKRDRINSLVVPALLGLSGLRPGEGSAGYRVPEGLRFGIAPTEVPPPLEFTGEALPGRPKGAIPLAQRGAYDYMQPAGPPLVEFTGAKPEVPYTEAEAPQTALEEIRARNARTTRQVKALFPHLSNEQAAALRNAVWGKPGEAAKVGVRATPYVPIPPRLTDAEAVALLKKGKESAPPVPALPVPKPGTVRLYQGKGGTAGGGTGEAWWTTNPQRAASFGPNVQFVDVPADVAAKAQANAKAQGSGTAGDHLLPDEWVRKAQPMAQPPAPKVYDTDILAKPAAEPPAPPETPPPAPTPAPKPPAPPAAPAAPAAAVPPSAFGLSPETVVYVQTPHPPATVDTMISDLAAGKQVLKNTNDAWKLGMSISSPEQLRALKGAYDAAVAAFQTEKNFKNAFQQQWLREAWEAATGTGSAGEGLSKAIPGYRPPFPDGKSAGLPTPPPREAPPVQAPPTPPAPTAPAPLMWLGKPVSYWEELVNNLPKGEERARLAKSLGVPNQPGKIAQHINRRLAEVKARGSRPGKLVWAAYRPKGAAKAEIGRHHPEILKRLGVKGFETPESRNTPEFGFQDEYGEFLTREQAAERAKLTGQDLKEFEPNEPAHSDETASATEPGKSISEQKALPPAQAQPVEPTAPPPAPPSTPTPETPAAPGTAPPAAPAPPAQAPVASVQFPLGPRPDGKPGNVDALGRPVTVVNGKWTLAAPAQEGQGGDISVGPGAASPAEFEERPDPEVIGVPIGSPAWNRIERGYRNLFDGFRQLFARHPVKQDVMSLANAARNLPDMAGFNAGQSVRVRSTEADRKAITVLMQALKMSGEGISAEAADRLGTLEFAADPSGYLQANQTDLQTAAQEFNNKGMKLEAQAALEGAQAMKYARKNFNRLRPLAESVKRKFDIEHRHLAASGVNVNYEQWYVPQRHEIDLFTAGDRPIVLGHSGGGGPSTAFKKAKVYEDYASAIEAGFVPRTLDIANLLEHYVSTAERVIAKKAFYNGMKSILDPVDAKPLVIDIPRRVIERPDGSIDVQESVPLGYERKEVMPGVAFAIHRGYSRLVNALTATSQLSQSAAFGAIQDVAAFEKHVGLALDTFHAGRTLQTELALTGKLSLGARQRLGRALVEYSPADLDAAVSKGEITQEQADWIRKPQDWQIAGRTVRLSPRSVLLLGVKNGLNVTRFADAMYRDWLRNVPVTSAVNRWVFEKMTRSAIAQSFISEFGRAAEANPGLDATTVARRVSRDINVLFGNLQSESLFRNPSLRSIMQVLFLAPTWVEALARREGRALLQVKRIPGQLYRGQPLYVPPVARAVGTGLAGYFVATQLLNLATRHQLTFYNSEEGHKLDAWIPDVTGKTRGFFISPLAVFGEIAHDVVRYAEAKPDLASALSQIGANKLGNLGRFIEIAAMGRDPLTGDKILGTGRRALQAGFQLVPVPISLSQIGREAASMAGLAKPPPPGQVQRQLTASLGFKTEPVPSAQNQIYNLADEWKLKQSPKLRAEVERRQREEFGSSDYRDLRMALVRNDPGQARRAYDALLERGKTPRTIRQTIAHPHPFTGALGTEQAFRRSLNPQQQQLYRQALEERRLLYHRFQQFLHTQR